MPVTEQAHTPSEPKCWMTSTLKWRGGPDPEEMWTEWENKCGVHRVAWPCPEAKQAQP
jgi:hypothetical protein